MSKKEISDRAGVYRMTVHVGLSNKRTEDVNIADLIDDYEDLSIDEFEAALDNAWAEWAWGCIDGGAEKL